MWLWMSGKRNVPVCRGHELANALYLGYVYLYNTIGFCDHRLLKNCRTGIVEHPVTLGDYYFFVKKRHHETHCANFIPRAKFKPSILYIFAFLLLHEAVLVIIVGAETYFAQGFAYHT